MALTARERSTDTIPWVKGIEQGNKVAGLWLTYQMDAPVVTTLRSLHMDAAGSTPASVYQINDNNHG